MASGPTARKVPAVNAQTVRSVAEPLRHEIEKIKGSRFIASVMPVGDLQAATGFVDARRAEFKDATHNCWAWRLGRGRDDWRYSDDGEPSGTGGRPILAEIDGRRLTNLAVVVTRYYGGTKLGTGGLIRAYGGCAAAALDLASIEERQVTHSLLVVFEYGLTGPVQGVLAAQGLEPVEADYGAEVRLTLEVPVGRVDTVRDDLVNAATGKIRISSPKDSS